MIAGEINAVTLRESYNRQGLMMRALLALALLIAPLAAERLPLRHYALAEGLVSDGPVFDIFQDSHGFLWLSTNLGISRFDGQTFQNYGPSNGLPSGSNIRQVLETRSGIYWVATGNGLFRYQPDGARGKLFVSYAVGDSRESNTVSRIAEDRDGGLWLGTFAGLYHLKQQAGVVSIRLVFRPLGPLGAEPDGQHPVLHLFVDRAGVLWGTGHYSGIFRILPTGVLERYSTREGIPALTAGPLFEDARGRIWLASAVGLLEMDSHPSPGRSIVIRRIDTLFGDLETLVNAICETPDGHLWLASVKGLLEFDGTVLRRYREPNGLAQEHLWCVNTDRAGDLWLGSANAGVSQMRRPGISTFDETDGIEKTQISGFSISGAGEFGAISRVAGKYRIFRWDRSRFRLATPQLPATVYKLGWGSGPIFLQDHLGEWWGATFNGLCRFPRARSLGGLDKLAASRVYTMADGLPGNNVYALFEDRAGDVWIGLTFPSRFGLAKWIRATGKIVDLSREAGVEREKTPLTFAMDQSGNVWIGFEGGGITRFRRGRFDCFEGRHGAVTGIYPDKTGSLLVATEEGLLRVKYPDSARPEVFLATSAGTPANPHFQAITGDLEGRIYLGSVQGVFQYEPDLGRYLHLTTADGLADNNVETAARDPQGNIWFGTPRGVSRLVPRKSSVVKSPMVAIREISIGEHLFPVSDLGAITVPGPELPADQNTVQIKFGGVDFRDLLRYRYRLQGATASWSSLNTQQTVVYPSLTPGSYRFQVEAENASGIQSTQNASFSFAISPPVWKRWWFLLGEVIGGCMALYSLYRFRLAQLWMVERIRNRIASDLHDDVGSSLTQIAILLEVAKQRLFSTDSASLDLLSRATDIAREATGSMGDIVWFVKPGHDSLGSLIARIRRYATDVLEMRDIACEVSAPEADVDLKIDIETQRQLLLVTKEAVHNIVRHANCTRTTIELKMQEPELVLRICDDGTGFDVEKGFDGTGLKSMKSRAVRLRGHLVIQSERGCGTCVELRSPRSKLQSRTAGWMK